nr:ribonuclease H-like domain-containing protein [Tanacetum cinerariifolium]
MTIETYNWASSAHQELHKIVREEIFPIVNQVDARLQNFEIHFLKEVAKFVGDFKSLINEVDASLAKHKALELEIEHLLKAVVTDASLAKHKALELEIEHLLKAVVSQDIMIIVQNESVVDTSDLQTELEQFQVLNYARENAHLKATYKNLFDSISVSCAQTKTIIASLQNELQSNIYKNAKLRTQLFKKVSDQKDNTQDSSVNTKFAKQPIVENLPKIGKTNALSKPVTSNSDFTPQESKSVNNDKVIAPGMFRINPSKTSREENHVPISQPHVITNKDVNSDLNGLSSTGVDNTKTRRPQPRSNTKNDRVPFASKSSRSKNKREEVEEHHRNLLLSKNKKHMLSACNNFMLDSQNVYSKVIQICLWCVDSGCSKHMTGNLNLLTNFTWKFMGTVCFGNDHVDAILGFGDLRWGNILITRVYFVEGLGLPKFKYHKEHLCPSCEQGKSKRASHPPKPVTNSRQRLHLLHMDLCGPMRIASINGKRYVLVIMDNYSRYTWVHFIRSKDEAPENGVVERRNQTLVEAARTMLIFSRALLFLWAEAIASVCFTSHGDQHISIGFLIPRSLILKRWQSTPASEYQISNVHL